jgi:hypothetical protein
VFIYDSQLLFVCRYIYKLDRGSLLDNWDGEGIINKDFKYCSILESHQDLLSLRWASKDLADLNGTFQNPFSLKNARER